MPDPVTPAATPPATPPTTTPAAVTPPASAAPAANTPPAAPLATPPATPPAGDPPPAAPPSTPPAEVTYTLNLPAESMFEPSAVERVTTFAKAEKLAPQTAQKVLDLAHAETSAVLAKQKTDYEAAVTGWEQSVKADAELGGNNYNRTLMRTKAAMDKYATPGFTEALKRTGFGNHPELVRVFEKIGAAMESDVPGRPGSVMNDGKAIADRMFPSSAGK